MASSIFRVSRTETEGQQSGPATLNKAQEPVKMRVYKDESDVDLSEIGDKEIFAVEEENDLANVYVTDLVQEGNMNPITSNAVARFTGANYSTDEVKTSSTWIDGKPIYRRVWTGTYKEGRYKDILPEGLIMITITGYIKYSQDRGTRYWVINAPQNISTNVYFASVWYNDIGFVQFETQGPFTGNDCAIIFEYVKTTD